MSRRRRGERLLRTRLPSVRSATSLHTPNRPGNPRHCHLAQTFNKRFGIHVRAAVPMSEASSRPQTARTRPLAVFVSYGCVGMLLPK